MSDNILFPILILLYIFHYNWPLVLEIYKYSSIDKTVHLLYSTRLSLTTHPQLLPLGYNVRPSSRHHSRSSLNAFFCVHLTHSTPIRYHDDVLEIYERSPTFFFLSSLSLSLSLSSIILLLCVQIFRRVHKIVDGLDYRALNHSPESLWTHLILGRSMATRSVFDTV